MLWVTLCALENEASIEQPDANQEQVPKKTVTKNSKRCLLRSGP